MSRRLALIIGNSLYRDKTLLRLISPDADVGALKDLLLDPEFGGFDDVSLVFNSASHVVRREIYKFFARKNREDLLLLYFSGHGVLDENGKLYLAVKNTDTEALRATAIPARDITEDMDNSRSKRQVLILDCCHSGAFERGTKGRTGATVGTASAFEGSGYGRVVLTASDATQYAWEGNKIIGDAENSLFTHYLIQGIQTGEADANQDGKITIDEIYDYIFSRILERTSKQTPGKWSFKEQGELIISHSPSIEVFEQSQPPASIELGQDEQLQKLYTDGLGGFWLEDWEKAIKNFEAILEISPGYQDIDSKLDHARRQIKNDSLYKRAVLEYEDGNLENSIGHFEELLSQSPDYKDAKELLEEAKKKKVLFDLYSEARQLFNSGNYQAVIKIFNRLQDLSPEYEDPEGLLGKAEVEVARVDQEKKLGRLYRQAILDVNAGRHLEARTAFLSIQEIKKGYKDTEGFLEKLDLLIEKTDKVNIKKKTKQDLKQDHKIEEKKPLNLYVAEQKITEETQIETSENFIGWLKSSIKEPKWSFRKREVLASFLGLVLMFLVSLFPKFGFVNRIIFLLIFPIIPAFFSITFGPIVGFIIGFLGSFGSLIFWGIDSFMITQAFVIGIRYGLFGLLLGLIYPSYNFRSINNWIRYGVIFLVSLVFSFIIFFVIEYIKVGYSIGWSLNDMWPEAASGLIIVPMVSLAYKWILDRRTK